jgi:hypothetical protein
VFCFLLLIAILLQRQRSHVVIVIWTLLFPFLPHTTISNYNGGAYCRLCRPYFAEDGSLTNVGTSSLTLWQQTVHTSLTNGPYVAFHTAGACAITLTVEPTTHQDKKKTDSKEYHDVEISVNCRGVKWDKLSLDEEKYSAKALMDAFNIAHLSLDAGDWHLEHVAWENVVSMQDGGRLGAIGGS